MTKSKLILTILLLLGSFNYDVFGQSNSMLASGTWIKLSVSSENTYKITYADLQSYGVDPGSIDPATFRIFGNGGGMLPQANSAARPLDLDEIAIEVVIQNDGSFNSGDYIIFYGSGPDKIEFDSVTKAFSYQHHFSSVENYYYLNFSQNTGKRVVSLPAEGVGNASNYAYNVYAHEIDVINILHSGRQWFGELFDLETTQTFNTGISEIESNTEIKLISAVMSTSLQNANFNVEINGVQVGSQNITANPDGTYSRKGTMAIDTFSLNKNMIDSNPLELTYILQKEFGVGYLDYFILQARTKLTYQDEPLTFYVGDLAEQTNISFSIANCPTGLWLWDVSDHNSAARVSFTQNGDIITFNASSKSNKFTLFDPGALQNTPIDSEPIDNQNLHASSNTDLLIVAPSAFLSQANTIAGLRAAEGLAVKVATPEQIYNEFSSGKPDITAIRDYTKYLYDNASLKYLLIFGKGTYDSKDILGSNLNKIVIYESRNSLQPLATYGSDDYLGFLEDDEGDWLERASGDHTLDIGVGRIPAIDAKEADNFVNKLIKYQHSSAVGSWRKEVLFVAENGDQNIHQRDAERLATLVDTTYAPFNTNKIYVDAYPIVVNPGSKSSPQTNNAIYEAINRGLLIINYTGHGNEIQWAKTRVFDKNVVDSLKNNDFLPLFVTATCEFGRHDDIGERSGGEDLIVKKITGGIATITTARPVFASTNYQLNLAFYKEVFEQDNGEFRRLGDIFIGTKNNSLNGVLNRNFSLLGDPSMKLSYANQLITIDSLNGNVLSTTDTLSAQEELTFKGSIRLANQLVDNSFSGELNISFLDRTRTKQTLGNLGGAPFTYKVRENILFKGMATVNNGEFSFTTVLPKDVSYNPANAKIALYAKRNDSIRDASGANIDFLVGSSSSSQIADNTPPEIRLFLGDTLYVKGRVVNPSTLLIANLSDKYGINTSSSQVGHSITYSLDGAEAIVLNEYYSTIIDDYTKGWIYYNLPELSEGSHTISFTAWDTSNNSSTATIDFYVSENGEIVISDFSNYPNPMRESTNFTFAHNLTGDDIEVTLEIINTSGQHVYRQTRSYNSAPSVINDWVWDGRNASGGKLNTGIYLYGIIVRSKRSNLTRKQYSRLFITN
jgi:peptidase C25-like protein